MLHGHSAMHVLPQHLQDPKYIWRGSPSLSEPNLQELDHHWSSLPSKTLKTVVSACKTLYCSTSCSQSARSSLSLYIGALAEVDIYHNLARIGIVPDGGALEEVELTSIHILVRSMDDPSRASQAEICRPTNLFVLSPPTRRLQTSLVKLHGRPRARGQGVADGILLALSLSRLPVADSVSYIDLRVSVMQPFLCCSPMFVLIDCAGRRRWKGDGKLFVGIIHSLTDSYRLQLSTHRLKSFGLLFKGQKVV